MLSPEFGIYTNIKENAFIIRNILSFKPVSKKLIVREECRKEAAYPSYYGTVKQNDEE